MSDNPLFPLVIKVCSCPSNAQSQFSCMIVSPATFGVVPPSFLFCLHFSSVSNLHPLEGAKVAFIWAHFLSCTVEREGYCKQTLLACVRSAHSGWTTWVFCFCFFSYSTLWDSNVPYWSCLWEDFLLCGNFSSFTTPSPGWVSIPKCFVSLFIFIFCPISFERDWFAFLGIQGSPSALWSCFVEVAPHADDLLMYWRGIK